MSDGPITSHRWAWCSGYDQLELELDAESDEPTGRKRWAWLLRHVFAADLLRFDHGLRSVTGGTAPLTVTGYDYAAVVESSQGSFVLGVLPDRLDIAPIECE